MHDPFLPSEYFQMKIQDSVEPKTVEVPKAQYFLNCALEALQERAAVRDAPGGERSADRAADILTAWTGKIWTASDVWRCLLAVKQAREIQGAFHADDYIDGAGYFALLGEAEAGLNRE